MQFFFTEVSDFPFLSKKNILQCNAVVSVAFCTALSRSFKKMSLWLEKCNLSQKGKWLFAPQVDNDDYYCSQWSFMLFLDAGSHLRQSRCTEERFLAFLFGVAIARNLYTSKATILDRVCLELHEFDKRRLWYLSGFNLCHWVHA